MRKLRLVLDSLEVQSFHPDAPDARLNGTVFGRADIDTDTGTTEPATGPTCPECPMTYQATCPTRYGDSCEYCIDPSRDSCLRETCYDRTCAGDSCEVCYDPTYNC